MSEFSCTYNKERTTLVHLSVILVREYSLALRTWHMKGRTRVRSVKDYMKRRNHIVLEQRRLSLCGSSVNERVHILFWRITCI